jgi:hypothetical protein
MKNAIKSAVLGSERTRCWSIRSDGRAYGVLAQRNPVTVLRVSGVSW